MSSESIKIRMTVSYDGTDFHGFQKQKGDVRTVQIELERALKALTGEEIELFGASRTDAGVHALGQVIHFTTYSRVPPERMGYALKPYLPRDITIMASEAADSGFHARFSATGKVYCYVIDRTGASLPFASRYSAHVGGILDEKAMRQAARYIAGEHDFSAFRNTGSSDTDPVRTIFNIDFARNGPFLVFFVSGTGFLYRMVRNLIGTLLEVGLGRMEPEDIPGIIESRDRNNAGPTMPPQGLFLVQVTYT